MALATYYRKNSQRGKLKDFPVTVKSPGLNQEFPSVASYSIAKGVGIGYSPDLSEKLQGKPNRRSAGK